MSIVVRNRAGGRYGQSAPWSRRVFFAQLARSGGMSAAGQAASDLLRATAALPQVPVRTGRDYLE